MSSAFEVDNTPPAISAPAVRADVQKTVVTFDVTDDSSPIQRVEYSEDGQHWQSIFPTDGIADSKQEHYELTIGGGLGARGVTLRATDSMNNVATRQVNR